MTGALPRRGLSTLDFVVEDIGWIRFKYSKEKRNNPKILLQK
jgi:hypothetical protein